MAPSSASRTSGDDTGRALRRGVQRRLVVLAAGGAALVVLLALVTSWGHLATGTRERALIDITTAQRLNADADAAHEELNGALLSALSWRAGGAEARQPSDILAEFDHGLARLEGDLEAAGALSLPSTLAARQAAVQADSSTYVTQLQGLIGRVLSRGDISQLAALESEHERLDSVREEFGSTLVGAVDHAARANGRARTTALAFVWTTAALALGLIGVMFLAIRRSVLGVTRRLQNLLSQNENDAARGEFGRRVVEAFDMADDEEAAREVVARAMPEVAVDLPMELLLADSSKAHLTRAAESPTKGAACCPVATPFECVAVRRGTAVTFPDSEQLHACPKLRDREAGPVSAACVPITFMGRAIGVLHATGEQGTEPDTETVERLSRLAAHTGSRIGTLRATRQTQLQAATDSLTGLVNRRTFDNEVRELIGEGHGFALAFGDLDHFKALNDRYGHDAGDRALRLFAKVLKETTRVDDVVARYGGEEFVVVLPGRSASEAVEAMQRIRTRLMEAVAASDAPGFTVSFGVTDSSMGTTVTDLVRSADAALLAAKSHGRDRVVLAGSNLVPEQARPVDEPVEA
jgi:diguanylate cyclase (GGDEF)-like protein